MRETCLDRCIDTTGSFPKEKSMFLMASYILLGLYGICLQWGSWREGCFSGCHWFSVSVKGGTTEGMSREDSICLLLYSP